MYKRVQRHHHDISFRANFITFLAAIFILILFLSYYVFVRLKPLDLIRLNKAISISSVILIGSSFILGPLARFSKFFVKKLEYRKPLGLWGFGFAAAHIFLSLILPQYRSFFAKNVLAIIFGIIAFSIFTFVAATSNKKSVRYFGFKGWQNIQRTGYIAYFLVLLHFTLIEINEFSEVSLFKPPPAAFIAFIFALIVLIARLIVLLKWKK